MKSVISYFIICCVFAVLGAIFIFRSHAGNSLVQGDSYVSSNISVSAPKPQTHSLVPTPSNQWYSSAYFSFPSDPIYALPIAYQISQSGLSFSYPKVVAQPNTVFASYAQDFTVGDGKNAYNKAQITSLGDWNVAFKLNGLPQNSMSFTLAHGVPYTIVNTTSQQIVFKFSNSFSTYNNNQNQVSSSFQSTGFVVTTQNHNYIIVPDREVLVKLTGSELTFNKAKVFIGLLDSRGHFDEFKKHAATEILTTQVTPLVSGSTLLSRYDITTSNGQALISLYPHQYDFLSVKPAVIGTYSTIRGTLQLISANSFVTQMPLITPPTTYPSLSQVSSDFSIQLQSDIAAYLHGGMPASKDYFLATWFGEGTDLLQLAQMSGLSSQKQQLQNMLESSLTNSLQYFSYESDKTSVMAKSPEFGNEQYNDHHFHYGYFLRTAAVLAQNDPKYLEQIQPLVEQMRLDIANIDRSNTAYPFFRNFDVYEAHSWADGKGLFNDGSNQESSSEAINAWYGLYLWSKVTHNDSLTTYALYAYNNEILGAKYYWFDTQNMYQQPYNHAIASLIWGGKADFSTWFSPNTNMKYGIQLLPMTPASFYLGGLPNFGKYDTDYHLSGGSELLDWGGLFVAWQSFYDPQKSMQYKGVLKNVSTSQSKSELLYFLYYNSQKK